MIIPISTRTSSEAFQPRRISARSSYKADRYVATSLTSMQTARTIHLADVAQSFSLRYRPNVAKDAALQQRVALIPEKKLDSEWAAAHIVSTVKCENQTCAPAPRSSGTSGGWSGKDIAEGWWGSMRSRISGLPAGYQAHCTLSDFGRASINWRWRCSFTVGSATVFGKSRPTFWR